jgi:Ribbon-helix-helix protein, copG family.
MVRTQIQLTEEQSERLKLKAAAKGVSMATLIRQAVDESLTEEDVTRIRERALSVAGTFRDRDGATDVSERHDDYLADAFEGQP